LIESEYYATYSSADDKRGILLVKDKEIVESLHPLLPDGFKLTRIEDRSAYLHLQLEDERTRKADIIKPFEDKDDITVISDLMTSEKSLKLINEIILRINFSNRT